MTPTITRWDEIPPYGNWLYRGLVGGVLLLIVVLAVLGIILANGYADPPRADRLLWEERDFLWAGGKSQNLSSNEKYFFSAPHPLPISPLTVFARAQNSEASSAWGLWFTLPDGYLLIAINTEGSHGYVTVRHCPQLETLLEDCPTPTEPTQGIQMVWKESLFLTTGVNEIYLHTDAKRPVLALRLNREWMWDIPLSVPLTEWGLWVRGGVEAGEIRWESLQIWGK